MKVPVCVTVTCEVVRMAGDHVALEQELGHPECVDDIIGGQVELDRLPGRDLKHRQRPLAPHVAGVRHVVLRVVELPAPLEPEHVHDHRRLGRQGVDVVLVLRGEVEEHRDQHERHRRVHDLDRHVVAHLRRQLVTALAVEDHRPQDQAPDQRTDGQAGDPGTLPERQDRLALLGDRVGESEPGERVVRAAGQAKDQEGKRDRHAHRPRDACPARTGLCGALFGVIGSQGEGLPRFCYNVSCKQYRAPPASLLRPRMFASYLRAGARTGSVAGHHGEREGVRMSEPEGRTAPRRRAGSRV